MKPMRPENGSYAYKGMFKPQNPLKYKGNPTNIIYRSSWELTLMSRFDLDEKVEWWQSEELFVSYMNPAKNRMARYFPDFLVHFNDGRTVMIEVKPRKELSPPKKSKSAKTSKRFIRESVTYAVNYRKWEAAKIYCSQRGWQFVIMTEDQIYGRNV